MVELINKATGTLMRVADNRLEEYLEAGHSLASAPKSKDVEPKVEEPKDEPKEEEPKAEKKTTKRKR